MIEVVIKLLRAVKVINQEFQNGINFKSANRLSCPLTMSQLTTVRKNLTIYFFTFAIRMEQSPIKSNLLIHVYPSQMEFEVRIQKMVAVYKKVFPHAKVCLAGFKPGGLVREFESANSLIILTPATILRIPFITTPILYLTWSIRLYRNIIRRFPAAAWNQVLIQSNSVFDLPVSFFLKKYYLNNNVKCRLVYDAHELETESNGLSGMKQAMAKWIERNFIAKADKVIVVGKRIAEWYSKRYNLPVEVIRNIPLPASSIEIDKQNTTIATLQADNRIKLLYLGSIQNGRGLRQLLEALENLESKYLLVITGFGPLKNEIIELTKSSAHVLVTDAIPANQLESYCSYFDLGISLIENTCLSYYYCLPNKLFEYYTANLPVVCSDFPEMADHVKENKAGFVVNLEQEKLASFFSRLTQDEIEIKKKELKADYQKLDWEQEAIPLSKYYHEQ